jgi:hypothetical protein
LLKIEGPNNHEMGIEDRWEKKGSSLSLNLFHFSIYAAYWRGTARAARQQPAASTTVPHRAPLADTIIIHYLQGGHVGLVAKR